MKAQKRRALKVLEQGLGQSIGYNIVARAPFVTGPLPWRPELQQHRPWTPADDGAARLWLKVPTSERLVQVFLTDLARKNRYVPDDGPAPTAPARLVANGARWCWEAKCPYCREWHRHMIVGYWNQLQPQRTLGFQPHPCDAPARGARGYVLVEKTPTLPGAFPTEQVLKPAFFAAKSAVRVPDGTSAHLPRGSTLPGAFPTEQVLSANFTNGPWPSGTDEGARAA